ncbi:DMT family transporter [uncultured Methylibium sp.]|uniref:DMT family transporter n=1 Tax=uncultured Methylibium sp. TaxID=381093 RepID=UPI0025E494A8|nr:DMT family transporter [uncultured Methylibium sp.]
MAPGARNALLVGAMPAVFVLIWSTGFVVARYGMPHAPPFGFLAVRYALSIVCYVLWVLMARAVWPTQRSQWLHLAVTGVLMHAGYLGGVWSAVKSGIGAGSVALIVGLQPVLTALWVSATGAAADRVGSRQWLGLALGFVGLLLVVGPRLGSGEVNSLNLGLACFALGAITIGTLYQKRYVAPCDVRTASAVQLLAALAVTLPLALFEAEPVTWHPELIGAMAWSVLVLTLGGGSLLYLLIQRGAATAVTSLLYLVPPCTAVMAWLLFGESLALHVLLGLALTAIGVSLVLRSPRAAAPPQS